MASSRRKFEDRIKRKEAEVSELHLKIREAQAYIQAMQDAIKLLPRDNDGGEAILRAGSSVALARKAILGAGEPLHVSKLLQAAGKELNRKNRAALSGSLAAYVRRGEIFTRPAPNTFGLVELERPQNTSDELQSPSESASEPPPNFGADDDEIPF